MFLSSSEKQRQVAWTSNCSVHSIDAAVCGQKFLFEAASRVHTSAVADKLHKAGFTARIGEWGFAHVGSSTTSSQESLASRRRRLVPFSAYQSPQASALSLTASVSSMDAPLKLSLLPFFTDSAVNRIQRSGFSPFASDVWSFGVSLFVARAGRLPWTAAAVSCKYFRAFLSHTQPHVLQDELTAPGSALWATDSASFQRSSSSTTDAWWQWPAGFAPALVHLLSGCLQFREAERFTMKDVVQHQWFLNPQWEPPAATCAEISRSSALAGEVERVRLPSLALCNTQRTDSSEDAASSGDDSNGVPLQQDDTADPTLSPAAGTTLPALSSTPRSSSLTSSERSLGSQGSPQTTSLGAPRRSRNVRWAPSPRVELRGGSPVGLEEADPK